MTTTETKRRYVPPIGTRVKLRTFADYTSRNIHPWCWFRVKGEPREHGAYAPSVWLELTNGMKVTDQLFDVPLDSIEPPIGWKAEGYTITVQSEKLADVISWLKRGIQVGACHDLGRAGTMYYAPLDNDPRPLHWSAPEVTDTIPADQTKELIRIVKLDVDWDAGMPAACKYCVNGKRTRENNAVLIGQDETKCPDCGVIAGFSFDEPYHARKTAGELCGKIRSAAECWVCNGTGQGKRYLTEMSKKERTAAIAELRRNGWTVSYRKGNADYRGWQAERETVVKEFGLDPFPQYAGIVLDPSAEDSSNA